MLNLPEAPLKTQADQEAERLRKAPPLGCRRRACVWGHAFLKSHDQVSLGLLGFVRMWLVLHWRHCLGSFIPRARRGLAKLDPHV